MTSQINFSLTEGEDRVTLQDVVFHLNTWLANDKATVFTYQDWADVNNQRNFCPATPDHDVIIEAILDGQADSFLATVETASGPRLLYFHLPVRSTQKILSAISLSPAAQAHNLYQDSLSTALILPKSYGFIEQKLERQLICSVQVLAPLPKYQTLGEAITAELAIDNSPDNRSKIINTLAHQLAIIHNTNLHHPAMRPCHLLWQPGPALAESSDQNSSRLLLLATSKAKFLRDLSNERRAVNLYQFYRYALCDANESERFRFIEKYCSYINYKKLDAEDLYRRVVTHYKNVTSR